MNKNLVLEPRIENILKERYYLSTESSWTQVSRRLSETIYPEMYSYILNRAFIPSTPTIMNLNTKGERKGTLSSCFILGVEDSIEGIMDSMKEAALVTKSAGGVGYNFSKLRGSNELVKSINANSGGVMGFIQIFDSVLDGVRQGGRRRGAGMSLLSIYHPNILQFIDAKAGDTTKYTRSNFSVIPDSEFYSVLKNAPDTIFQTRNISDEKRNNLVNEAGELYTYKKLWDKIIHNAWSRAEPGIFNGDIAADRCTCKHITRNVFSNPCLTGDTLVYVADGRGNVPIKTLAEEGKDVDVFSMSHDGEVVIKKMMNPRLTRKQAEVYKITFDSGMEIKTTANHSLVNTDGNPIEVKYLVSGDSIKSIVRHEMSIGEAYRNKSEPTKVHRGMYYFVENSGKLRGEHRIIAENSVGDIDGMVVHHTDYDGKNNSPSNLKIMTYNDHKELHRKDKLGSLNPVHRIKNKPLWKRRVSLATSGIKNPNSNNVSNDDIIDLIKNHSKITTFNLMCANECRVAGLPSLNTESYNGKYRYSLYEDYCSDAGVGYIPGNVYYKLKSQVDVLKNNYDYALDKNKLEIIIRRECDRCKSTFEVGFENRHVTYCSHSCLSKDKFKPYMFNKGKLSETYLSNGNVKRRLEKTLEVFRLYKNYKYSNFKKENELANSIIRPNNIFCPSLEFIKNNVENVDTVNDLIKLAETHLSGFVDKNEASKAIGKSYNHKVVFVEYVGNEDVYDGTVEDTHCFFIGGSKSVNEFGRNTYEYILSKNCSEYVHIPYTSCNLGSFNVAHFTKDGSFDWKEFESAIEKSVIYMNGIIDQNDYPLEKIRKETLAVRPIGIGVMGLAHSLFLQNIPYDSQEGSDFTAKLIRFLTLASMRKSMEISKQIGKSYPYYDYDVFMDANRRFFTEASFMNIDVSKLKEDIKKYGIYNSCETSLAPTGTISYIADCSGGIEPVFGLVFTRKIEKENKNYEHVYLIDPIFKKFIEETYPEHTKEIYKFVSSNKGSCQKCPYLTAVEQLVFKVAGDITPEWHVKILAAAANNTSLSVSKTINLPNNCSEKALSDVFLKAEELGIIGVTVYRDGSREGILVHENPPDINSPSQKVSAAKRPKELEGEIFAIDYKKDKLYVAIGLNDGKPYEVFTGLNFRHKIVEEKGKIVKLTKNKYIFVSNSGETYQLSNGHTDATADALTRLISLGLRHHANISFVCEQLSKVEGDMFVFSKVIARVLKKYIENNTAVSGKECSCGGKLVYESGCVRCLSCGDSHCS